VLLLGILKYYTFLVEEIASYQAPIAFNLVLFSPIWVGLFYLPGCFRRNCPVSFFATRVTRSFLRFIIQHENVLRSRLFFPLDQSYSKAQQDAVFHEVNREILYFSVVLSTLTNMRRVANVRPSYSIKIFFQEWLLLYKASS